MQVTVLPSDSAAQLRGPCVPPRLPRRVVDADGPVERRYRVPNLYAGLCAKHRGRGELAPLPGFCGETVWDARGLDIHICERTLEAISGCPGVHPPCVCWRDGRVFSMYCVFYMIGQGRPGLGWSGLGWAGLGRAGLGWAGQINFDGDGHHLKQGESSSLETAPKISPSRTDAPSSRWRRPKQTARYACMEEASSSDAHGAKGKTRMPL
mmetsp:Transcript_12771/g.47175  ORF Transcript_12771/g.47175 Transcript_12771/m.47175 type:complete len:209 (-) Transcript_12771:123-749(-)